MASLSMSRTEREAFLAGTHVAIVSIADEGRGPLAILLLVFLGGLALNLTPCVLPMIPINLAISGAGSAASSRLAGFKNGAIYGAGMALAYGLLGLGVVLTGAKFGTINSSVWFNVVIAVVFAPNAVGGVTRRIVVVRADHAQPDRAVVLTGRGT